ncbi:MAG: SRPBCC domain-containing protein [Gemmatimonadota bacterium]
MTSPSPALPPIVRETRVPVPPGAAFRRFTREMGSWWPLDSHSVAGSRARSLEFEERVGGTIAEIDDQGQRHVWGTVTVWEPPSRVRFTWHPGREAGGAQDVEVRFEGGDQSTRVTLTMSGWERLAAPLARKARRGYPIGWAYMLDRFAGRRTLRVLAFDLAGRLLARRR